MRNPCKHHDAERVSTGWHATLNFTAMYSEWCRDCGAYRESWQKPKHAVEHGKWRSPKLATKGKLMPI